MADIKSERLQLEALENLFKQKRFSEALNFSKKLIRDYPHSFPIKLLHVRTLKELNRLGEAVEALNEMMQLFPNNINLLAEGGILALKRNKFDEALEYYNRILFLDPFNADAKESIDRINTIKKSGGGPSGKKMDFVTYHSEQFNRTDTIHEFDVAEVLKAVNDKKISSSDTVTNTTATAHESARQAPPPTETPDLFENSEPEPSLPPPILFDDLGLDEELVELPSISDIPPVWHTEEALAEEEESIPTDTPEALEFPDMAEPISPPALDFGDLGATENLENENLEPPMALDPILDWGMPEESPVADSENLVMPEDTATADEVEEAGMLSIQEELEKETEFAESEIPNDQLTQMPPPPDVDFGDFDYFDETGDLNEVEEPVPAPLEEDFSLGWEPPVKEEPSVESSSGSDIGSLGMSEGEEFDVSQFYSAVPDVTEPEPIEPMGLDEPVAEEIHEEIHDVIEEEILEDSQEELQDVIEEEIQEDSQEVVEEEAQIITESAAELYLKQGLLEDAAMIYAKLYNTRKEERFLIKINQLKGIRANQRKIDVLNEFLKVIQNTWKRR